LNIGSNDRGDRSHRGSNIIIPLTGSSECTFSRTPEVLSSGRSAARRAQTEKAYDGPPREVGRQGVPQEDVGSPNSEPRRPIAKEETTDSSECTSTARTPAVSSAGRSAVRRILTPLTDSSECGLEEVHVVDEDHNNKTLPMGMNNVFPRQPHMQARQQPRMQDERQLQVQKAQETEQPSKQTTDKEAQFAEEDSSTDREQYLCLAYMRGTWGISPRRRLKLQQAEQSNKNTYYADGSKTIATDGEQHHKKATVRALGAGAKEDDRQTKERTTINRRTTPPLGRNSVRPTQQCNKLMTTGDSAPQVRPEQLDQQITAQLQTEYRQEEEPQTGTIVDLTVEPPTGIIIDLREEQDPEQSGSNQQTDCSLQQELKDLFVDESAFNTYHRGQHEVQDHLQLMQQQQRRAEEQQKNMQTTSSSELEAWMLDEW
jgi:hypothetical protein